MSVSLPPYKRVGRTFFARALLPSLRVRFYLLCACAFAFFARVFVRVFCVCIARVFVCVFCACVVCVFVCVFCVCIARVFVCVFYVCCACVCACVVCVCT